MLFSLKDVFCTSNTMLMHGWVEVFLAILANFMQSMV